MSEPEKDEPLSRPLPPVFVQQGRQGFRVCIGRLALPSPEGYFKWEDDDQRELGFRLIRALYKKRGANGNFIVENLLSMRSYYDKHG